MSRTTIWVATAAVAIASLAAAAPAHAGVNEVRTVTFEPDAATTRVVVRSTQTPTFSVYKLEKPTRVVVDVPNARLAASLLGHDSVASLSANTWAVSGITAQQLDDGNVRTALGAHVLPDTPLVINRHRPPDHHAGDFTFGAGLLDVMHIER